MQDLADALTAPPESVFGATPRGVTKPQYCLHIIAISEKQSPDERKVYGSNNIGGGRRTCDSRVDFV